MGEKNSSRRRRVPKTVLRLPELDQAKSAVLNSLSSAEAQPKVLDSIGFLPCHRMRERAHGGGGASAKPLDRVRPLQSRATKISRAK
jgi:hypothetical protein